MVQNQIAAGSFFPKAQGQGVHLGKERTSPSSWPMQSLLGALELVPKPRGSTWCEVGLQGTSLYLVNTASASGWGQSFPHRAGLSGCSFLGEAEPWRQTVCRAEQRERPQRLSREIPDSAAGASWESQDQSWDSSDV